MLTFCVFFASFLALFFVVKASPLGHVKRQAVSVLTTDQIDGFTPFTHFASTAYCKPDDTAVWACGENCEANPDFIPVASGGDGAVVQFWFVGYDPSLDSVIVAHQGTDTSKIVPILTDVNLTLEPLDGSLFPGFPSSIEAHDGFANAQATTAVNILLAVQATISQHGTGNTTIVTVGHSLGCAIAILDAIYLQIHLSVNIRAIGYGCPRVGNQDLADYLDANIDLAHVTNKKDIVPTLPGRFLGFVGSSGEKHISENNVWFACAGQDNTSTDCSTGDVPNILAGNTDDHTGPYNGISMGC